MILITGGAGFIGSDLCRRLLRDGRRVAVFLKPETDARRIEDLDVKILRGDVRDYVALREATRGVDVIVHLAVASKGSLENINNTNLSGLKNVLEAAKDNAVQQVIHFSSVAVYGEQENVIESSPFKPYDNYGKSKVLCEEYIREFKKTNMLPITIVRPSHVYGPGGKSNIQDLFRVIRRRRFFIPGRGTNLINVVYVDDLADATAKMILNPKAYDNDFIISDAQPYPFGHVVAMIAETCHVPAPIRVPYGFAMALGFLGDVISLILRRSFVITRGRVANLARSRSFSIAKAQRELGYHPKVPFEEGARNAFLYYQRERLL